MPPTSGGPLPVEVNTFVRELGPLNLEDNSYRVQLTLRQKFNDSRLAHPGGGPVHILGEEVRHIWTPDTFIRNERSSVLHGALHPNMYARISPDGEILMSAKMTVVASCAHLAQNLKVEGSATCVLDIASYGLPDHLIDYNWKSEDKPVQFSSDTASYLGEDITLKDFSTDMCQAITTTGTYTCLRIRFVFEKKSQD